MTRQQTRQIDGVRDKLQECREALDTVMYYTEPISEEEHQKVREIYDMICKVTDKL